MILRVIYLLIILSFNGKQTCGFNTPAFNTFAEGSTDFSRTITSLTFNNDSLKAVEYHQKGEAFRADMQLDSAIYYAYESMQLCFKNKFWDCYQRSGADLVLSLILADEVDSADHVNKKVRKAFENKLSSDTLSYARLLNFQAWIYNITRDLDSGIIVMERVMQLNKLVFKDSVTLDLARTYNNLGAMYTDYQIYDKGLKYYDSALAIHQHLSKRQSEYAAGVYSNKAIVLKASGKFEESLEHNRQSYEIFKKLLPGDHPRLALCHFNIAHDLIDRNHDDTDISQALDHLEQGKKIMDRGGNGRHTYMIDFYRYSAKANQALQQYDLAISFFLKAIELNQGIYGDQHADIGIYKEELAEVYRLKGDFASAENQLQEALKLLEKELGSNFKRIALIYSTMGSVAADRKEFKEAIESYNKAISYFIPDADFQSPFDNPPVTELVVDQNLFLILQKKSKALLALYQTENDLNYLQAALSSYILLSDYIQFSRKGFSGTLSKLKLSEKTDDIYQKGIEIAIELYEHTRRPENLHHAFMFSDAYKSGVLLENIEENRARVFANIDKGLLAREDEIKANIDLTKKRIFELKNETPAQTGTLKDLKTKLFLLKTDLENLSKIFESRYPTYYQIKYSLNQTNVEHLRKNMLGSNQCLIQYFLGDSVLYIFGLTRRGIIYDKKPWNSQYVNQASSFLSSIRQIDFDRFTREGHALYRVLLEGILDQYDATHQKIDNLVIIPDRILGYIPFEILIKNPATEQGNYPDLDYLIKDFEISYHYSANLLSQPETRRPKNFEKAFIGFAPEFSVIGSQQLMALTDTERAYLDSASALPGARLEVERSAEMLGGIANIGASASEYNFKQQSQQAGIIHLASHSLINDQEPLYSRLIFDNRNDTIEDGLLHTYELYNMQLNADLAVLSACNTGIGKYYHGEGIMSLARGFMYAGVPNVMMSLWPISDRSTREIMQYFYEGIADGKPKSNALRLAKLRYLRQADPLSSNPYYWGGFILLGKINETSATPGLPLIFSVSAGLLLLAIVVFMWKRRFGKSNLT